MKKIISFSSVEEECGEKRMLTDIRMVLMIQREGTRKRVNAAGKTATI